ncbi:MAG: ferrous iron transport protein B [Anaerolineae bacterium]|nr:ferrous iron transport protein B [Anaerolineae bacterium]
MPLSFTIALAGNPNVGKSTIFNALTGTRQHVGNWPGKTVEKKEGTTRINDYEIVVVDLPGTYSLTAYSLEEVIARDFIVNEKPSMVVAVVDASNPERNLYLVAQLLELEVPVIVALNMSDVAHSRGLKIDAQELSKRLGGIPVVETIGNRSVGIDKLKRAIFELATREHPGIVPQIAYGDPLEAEIDALQAEIEQDELLSQTYHPRWLAIKLLEEDEDVTGRLAAGDHETVLLTARQAAQRILDCTGEDAETLIANRRYMFIGDVVSGAVVRPTTAVETRSDKIDKVVTHRVWGVPIFLLLMWILFQFTANVSTPLLDWIGGVVNGPITRWALAILDTLGVEGTWLAALVVDGIIAGVGGVLIFVPVLLFLYLAVAVLEDSGYMARAAFVMDRVMRLMGLHGKSFMPMMVGFGCTVPAVYATRALENEDDRKLTAFLTTFMSCGARLPVYVVFGAAFFGDKAGNLTFAMYVLGIATALFTGFVIKRIVYRNKPPQPFVLELPPYRLPTPTSVWLQVWENISEFLQKATTVILACSIVIWLLLALPINGDADSFNNVQPQDSVFGSLAGTIAPVFGPAGFDSWRTTGALISGFIAKEVVVGTMNQVYVGEAASSTPGEADKTNPFRDDVGEIVTGFGDAVILTAQEIVNIVPRTVNIIPGVHIPEADWLNQQEEKVGSSRLEGALVAAFERTAGSPDKGRLAAVAFNVFVLLYVPCMTAVAAMRQEFGTRWMAYQIVYTAGIAWLAAVIVYQGGLLLGLG